MGFIDGPVTDLDGVTATAIGSGIIVAGAPATIVASAGTVTTGGTWLLQGSIDDGTTWVTITTVAVTANGISSAAAPAGWQRVRTHLSVRTDGTYTTKIARHQFGK